TRRLHIEHRCQSRSYVVWRNRLIVTARFDPWPHKENRHMPVVRIRRKMGGSTRTWHVAELEYQMQIAAAPRAVTVCLGTGYESFCDSILELIARVYPRHMKQRDGEDRILCRALQILFRDFFLLDGFAVEVQRSLPSAGNQPIC